MEEQALQRRRLVASTSHSSGVVRASAGQEAISPPGLGGIATPGAGVGSAGVNALKVPVVQLSTTIKGGGGCRTSERAAERAGEVTRSPRQQRHPHRAPNLTASRLADRLRNGSAGC